MTTTRLPTHRAPTAPGVILRKEFMEPVGMAVNALAEKADIDRVTLSRILNGQRNVTAVTSVKLGLALGVNGGFFFELQNALELWDAEQRLAIRTR